MPTTQAKYNPINKQERERRDMAFATDIAPVDENEDTFATETGTPEARPVYLPTAEQNVALTLAKTGKMFKINAIAGSGKTATLVYVAGVLTKPSLYMAFNKSMADEAAGKFPRSHVTCMTTHSLAYRNVGHEYNHKLSRPRSKKYINVAGTGLEIANYFRIKDWPIDEANYIPRAFIGTIIKDTVARYEMSAADTIKEKMIPYSQIKDMESALGDYAKQDIPKLIRIIYNKACALWEERIDVDSIVLCTHNTYLKLYQLSKPDLSHYGVIYLDEAQDGNSVTMDIILRQKNHSQLIFVGDKFQQIYAWNGSVNTLQNIQCASASLTKSFRYGPAIAEVAELILNASPELGSEEIVVKGNDLVDSKISFNADVIDYSKPYTILFRTNMQLINTALRLLVEGKDTVSVNIDVREFCKLLESAMALRMDDLKKIKHADILPYTKWEDLLDESKSNPEFRRLTRLIEEGEATKAIKVLKSHVNPPAPHITLTTAHKSKGMEYSQVILNDDFPSNYDKEGKWVGLFQEDINLLYVSATRALHRLQYNTTVRELLERAVEVAPKGKVDLDLPHGDIASSMLEEQSDETELEQFVEDIANFTIVKL